MGQFKDLDIRLQEIFPNGHPEAGLCEICNTPFVITGLSGDKDAWTLDFECQEGHGAYLRSGDQDTALLTDAMTAIDAALFETYDKTLTDQLLAVHQRLRQRVYGQP